MTREERFERLYGRVRGCQLCPLALTRTLSVPGEGNTNAEVMFIGEAPGANEDKQGRPFVGAAGQFLDELLGHAGLDRRTGYICNVLKCRPPNNRDPLPDEIEACRDYLDEQIDLIDPLVIVTLGRYSMAKFFPKQTISRIHGTVKEVAGRFYVPMYHPAAALHQGNLRQVIVDDFQKLPAILERARRDAGAPVMHHLTPAPVTAAVRVVPAPPPSPASMPDDLPWELDEQDPGDWNPPDDLPAASRESVDGPSGVASVTRVATDVTPTSDQQESTAPGPQPSRTSERPAQPQIRLFD